MRAPVQTGDAPLAKILLVDDEEDFAYLVGSALEQAGFQVITALTGLQGFRAFFDHRPDLAVVDLMMPEIDGFELARRIREVSDIPVLVLSVRDGESDKVRGLEGGADDYLVKPVGMSELVARVRAALRRSESYAATRQEARYVDDELVVDLSRHEASVRGQLVELTKIEFRLLACLVRHPGQVMSYEDILQAVWGSEYESPGYVTWHVGRLRKKIENDPANPERIKTVRGVGYMYEPPTESTFHADDSSRSPFL